MATNKKYLQTSDQGVVSSIGVTQYEHVDESYLDNLLSNINKNNIEQFHQENAILLEEQKQREEADRIARNQAHRQQLLERYEEEQKAKMERELKEQEEFERFQAEMEEKKASNPLYKAADFAKSFIQIPTFPSKKDEDDIVDAEKHNNNQVESIKNKTEQENTKKKKNNTSEKKEKSQNASVSKKNTSESKDSKNLFNLLKKKDITKTKNSISQMPDDIDYEYLATHDEKTGLFNANAYKITLERIDEKDMTIVCFDVNNLKRTNDTMGHSAGDKLLSTIADGLEKCFPKSVYRTGGDEFIALLPIVNVKALDKRITQLKQYFENKSNTDKEGIIYAVSVGYCVSDGQLTKQEILDIADKNMYEDKKLYKQAHPELDVRTAVKSTTKESRKPVSRPEIPYDDRLPQATKDMKMLIQEQHMTPDDESTERAMAEIQRRHHDVLYVLIADKKFNSFMIIKDVSTFLDLVVNQMDNFIDYSYLYVVYDDGYKYYGNDNLVPGVAKLFADIEHTIRKTHAISEKDLLKIKGINVFKEIFIG